MEYYSLKICGLKRKLPLKYVGRKTRIASFSILGDVELIAKIADDFAKKLKKIEFDYLVGPEVKVVPLIQSIAEKLGHKRFVVCRKSVKPYMVSPIILKPLSHFPKHVQPLVIDGSDAAMIKNRKVVIVDDVVSTGVTMRMMKKLMEKAGAQLVACFAVLKQGQQFDEIENMVYLAQLPVFKS